MFIFIGIVTCVVESWRNIPQYRWLNVYILGFGNIYLNRQKEISAFTTVTEVWTSFIQYACITLLIQLIHYLFNSPPWRRTFCLHLNLAIVCSLQSARMTESQVFLNLEIVREIRKRLYFLNPIGLWSSFNYNHTHTTIEGRRKFISKVGYLEFL